MDIMMETTAGATSSGSVATVAQPMMATERRINPSVYANQGSKPAKMDDHCPECKCNPCECHEESRKAPDAPKAKEFGLWQNSVLAGKEQKSKKTKKKTNESTLNERDFGSGQRQLELEEAHKDDEDSVGELGLPSVQRGLKKMAARHAGENYTPAQLAALRKRLDAAGAAADEKEAARKARIDKPYSEYAPDFKKDVPENQKSTQVDEIRATPPRFSRFKDSMTDDEWNREAELEKKEEELERERIRKNHVSQFKTKEAAIQYANDKIATYTSKNTGVSVYSMPDGGFDICSTARTRATEIKRKKLSDAGGKSLGTIGPKYKHPLNEISSKLAGNYYQSVSRKHIDKLGGIRPNMYDRIEKDMGPNRKKGIDRATNRIMRDAEKVKPDVTKTSVKGKKRKDDIEEGLRNKLAGAALAGAMAFGGGAQAQGDMNYKEVVQQIQSGKIQNAEDLLSLIRNAKNLQMVWKRLQIEAGVYGKGATNDTVGINQVIKAISNNSSQGNNKR